MATFKNNGVFLIKADSRSTRQSGLSMLVVLLVWAGLATETFARARPCQPQDFLGMADTLSRLKSDMTITRNREFRDCAELWAKQKESLYCWWYYREIPEEWAKSSECPYEFASDYFGIDAFATIMRAYLITLEKVESQGFSFDNYENKSDEEKIAISKARRDAYQEVKKMIFEEIGLKLLQ